MGSLYHILAYLLCSLDLNSFALSEILGGADRLLFLILFFLFSLAIYISLGEVHRSNHSVNIFYSYQAIHGEISIFSQMTVKYRFLAK